MLPDDVREAVERLTEPTPCDYETYKTIRTHLLAREAEVEELKARVKTLISRNLEITAHLSENSRG